MVSGIINGDIYAQHNNEVKRIELLWSTGAAVGAKYAADHVAADSLYLGASSTSAAANKENSKVLVSAALGALCIGLIGVGGLLVSRGRQSTKVPTDLASLTRTYMVAIV